jgi:hypothetical protein
VRLTGETAGRPQGDRVPINIHPETRRRLVELLYLPQMRGVGYSEFIDRAVAAAAAEIQAAQPRPRYGLVMHYDDGGRSEPFWYGDDERRRDDRAKLLATGSAVVRVEKIEEVPQ